MIWARTKLHFVALYLRVFVERLWYTVNPAEALEVRRRPCEKKHSEKSELRT